MEDDYVLDMDMKWCLKVLRVLRYYVERCE